MVSKHNSSDRTVNITVALSQICIASSARTLEHHLSGPFCACHLMGCLDDIIITLIHVRYITTLTELRRACYNSLMDEK